jgi:hypothetical protein
MKTRKKNEDETGRKKENEEKMDKKGKWRLESGRTGARRKKGGEKEERKDNDEEKGRVKIIEKAE